MVTLGAEFILSDNYLEITNNSTPLRITFVPELDTLNNIIDIKYSAKTLPSEDINPTILSVNTLRWKNF